MCEGAGIHMTGRVYLLLYTGQQVFENGQLGHKVLQLLVSTLIHWLMGGGETKR